jgi:hypothetical protein
MAQTRSMDVDRQHVLEHAAWTWTSGRDMMGIQHVLVYAACPCLLHVHASFWHSYGKYLGIMGMDTQYALGFAAWAWTCSLDIDLKRGHGHAAYIDMDLEYGHKNAIRTWKCSLHLDMQHEHGHAACTCL